MGAAKYRSVLIIDDSEIDVLVHRRLMQLTEFAETISSFPSAEEALDHLRNECTDAAHSPDIIFLDMHLPVMSGLEFLEHFSKLPEFLLTKTQVYVLTLLSRPEQREKVASYPFVMQQLEKPLTVEKLRAIIVAMVQG